MGWCLLFLSVFLSVLLSFCLPSFLCLCTSHCDERHVFLCLLSDTALIYEQTPVEGETQNKWWGKTTSHSWNDKAEGIYLSFWHSMEWVSVSNAVLYNHCHPLMTMNKIISNQITAKGDFMKMCVYQGRVFIHMRVCLCVHTFIT